MREKKYNALDVALHCINYCANKEKPISNLKLQKLLYYIQATFLVEMNKVCFDDEILRWEYGPVVEKVYFEFRDYGYNDIPKDPKCNEIQYDHTKNTIEFKNKKYDKNIYDKADLFMINKVLDRFIDYSASKLVTKTHKEEPWKNTKPNQVIQNKIIKEYYDNNKEKLEI